MLEQGILACDARCEGGGRLRNRFSGARRVKRLGAILVVCLLPPPAAASELFRIGEVEGVANFTLAYGILARVEERDPSLVGIGNGGTAPSVNFDDGNLNYDEGIVANQLRGTAEVALRWKNFGAFVRAYGFYDFENELGGGRRTELTDDGQWAVSSGAGLQDAYLTANFSLADVPLQLRVGNQVVNWGESNFLRFGVDVVNPLDLVSLSQPTTTFRDLFVRQGMIWGVANLTEHIAVEAFYQYDWEPVPLPPVGWFFSGDDLLGIETNVAFEGFGAFSDQGTDLDAAFNPTNQPLGFDPDFMKLLSSGRDEPGDQGQFGLTVQTFLPILNAPKLALHFMNYHSRLPMVNGFTADSMAVESTEEGAVNARAATFGVARSDAELLTISELANETRYGVTYPEDLRMLGFSFNTATISTGTLIAGEVSHHFNWPVQITKEQVILGSLSPVQFNGESADVFRKTSLEAFGRVFGPDEVVKGWFDTGKTQVSLNVTQLFGPRLGASQSLLSFDFGWAHFDEVPNPGPFDKDSWGYRVVATLTYNGVFGGLTLRPRLRWTHDVDGVTPAPGGAFIEDRKTLTAGVDLQYTQRWTASLSYFRDFGGIQIAGVPVNPREDRDFVRFNVTFHY
jgi:hypothetical protein